MVEPRASAVRRRILAAPAISPHQPDLQARALRGQHRRVPALQSGNSADFPGMPEMPGGFRAVRRLEAEAGARQGRTRDTGKLALLAELRDLLLRLLGEHAVRELLEVKLDV